MRWNAIPNAPVRQKTGEAARVLGLTSNTIRSAVRRGDLPGIQIGRQVLVSRSGLEELLTRGSEPCQSWRHQERTRPRGSVRFLPALRDLISRQLATPWRPNSTGMYPRSSTVAESELGAIATPGELLVSALASRAARFTTCAATTSTISPISRLPRRN